MISYCFRLIRARLPQVWSLLELLNGTVIHMLWVQRIACINGVVEHWNQGNDLAFYSVSAANAVDVQSFLVSLEDSDCTMMVFA